MLAVFVLKSKSTVTIEPARRILSVPAAFVPIVVVLSDTSAPDWTVSVPLVLPLEPIVVAPFTTPIAPELNVSVPTAPCPICRP